MSKCLLTFLLIIFSSGLYLIRGQTSNNCQPILDDANRHFVKSELKEALQRLNLVDDCDIERKLIRERQVLQRKIFDAIERLNENLKKQKDNALLNEKIAQETALKNEIIADTLRRARDSINNLLIDLKKQLVKNERIINAFYFYNDSLAMAYKNFKYGYINKNGDPVIGYQFSEAQPFNHITGYAKVKAISDDNYYLLDVKGTLYRLAKTWEIPDSQAEALEINEEVGRKTFKLSQFPRLKLLFINSNRFASYLHELNRLEHLQHLSLKDNSLIAFPIVITQLNKLKQLYIFSGSFTHLPPQIGQMKSLNSLDISATRLTVLPNEIGELKNLQKLNLVANQLTVLSPQIGELKNLQVLGLSKNQLTALPQEIGKLRNLQKLNLAANQLTALSPEIGKLEKLNDLYLPNNKLKTLPDEISQLKQLKTLDLSRNSITEKEKKRIRQLLPNTKITF